jgi:hypothetical protein
MRQRTPFDDLQRPRVEKKSLWTADQEAPLTRASFDPSNIASNQIQKSRNQALQSKSRKTYQSPQQASTAPRQLNSQSSPTPTPAPNTIFGKSSNQGTQNQPKDEASFDIVLQPETRPISQEQLVAEVKGSKYISQQYICFPFLACGSVGSTPGIPLLKASLAS